jgi:hypothetical protein
MTIPDYDEDEDAGTAIPQRDGTRSMRDAVNAAFSNEKPLPRTSSRGSRKTSSTSSSPSASSTGRYRRPINVKQMAGQVLDLATAVINGDVQGEDLDRARLYASLARTTAQLVNSEVTRARFLREQPDLTFFEGEDDEG